MVAAAAPAANVHFNDPSFCKGQTDIQTGLMVVTVAASVLSLIPPTRFVGAVILRSVAVVSSLDICQDSWRNSGWQKRAIMSAKVAATGLAVAAVAAASPALLIAGLASDIAVQIFEILKAPSVAKKLLHFGFLAVNVVVLTGVVLASWELLLAASIVSTVAMLSLGIYIGCKAQTWKDGVNMVCYLALCGVGVASGVIVSHLQGWQHNGHTETVTETRNGREYTYKQYVIDNWYLQDIGGKLPREHYPTLSLGGHTTVGPERVPERVND